MKDFVSIIIPVYNEEKYIDICINSILNMDYDKENLEIIFVDGGSEDRTLDIIKDYMVKFDNIKFIVNERKIVPISMNRGIDAAKGNLIMRLDAHSEYPKDYISKLVYWKRKLKADNVGAVCETKIRNENKKSVAISKVLSNKFGVGNGLFRTGVSEVTEVDTVPFGLYDKEILIKLNGYNEKLIRNQDIELNSRLRKSGGKIFLVPDVKFTYYSRENYKKLCENNFQNGLWNIVMMAYSKNKNSLSIRHFIPLVFILSLLIPIFLSFLNWRFILIAILSISLYFILIGLVSINLKDKNTDIKHIIWAFICLHFSYGLGSLVGIMKFLKIKIGG